MTTVSSPILDNNRLDHQRDGLLAWQGWHVRVPTDWSPIKIEGDFDRGFVAMADLDRERIGIRWQQARKNGDPHKLVAAAMINEVGVLAAAEATASNNEHWSAARLYIEPDPPGRDVWIAYSAATGRLVQIVYQAVRRDNVLRDTLVPHVRDTGEAGGATLWAAFWLNVTLPRPMKLNAQRLNVGDLALSFATPAGELLVRQMAAARVALARRPLSAWVTANREPKRYRPVDEPETVTVAGMAGVMQRYTRRRRLVLARWIPRGFVSYCMHDTASDRLTIVRAPDDDLAQQAINGIGQLNAAAVGKDGGP
ncbi:MAG TPA: hypothetical protein VGN72_12225 [Tepidisphaeraceae bacterium]|nr:hypothetical protein [Tepidisphaeraceae bacterium]